MSPTPTSSPRQPGAGAGAGVARHAAFKVHRDSHSIHKATSPLSSGSGSTNSSVSSSSNAIITSSSHHRPAPAPQPPRRQQQQQQPVIIYTHSPKVIRTNPRDFMSIVHKLTGLDSHGRGALPPVGRVNSGSVVAAAPQDESSSSSSKSCANTHATGPPPYADSQLMPPPLPAPPLDAHFMAPDIPLLFAPDAAASDLQQLCAPRGLYGQFPPPVDAVAAIGPVMSTNMNSAASNGGAVFSPSMVETVRTFSGYN
ncbi:VQ motif-containing protein 8, chloroplastic-like [Miscanthus floridulus]|uniref:VQ motif-containing protein 8, chloroplastic-like n=1 Tax=Miscanthus floridulus TaxID=154761 RepID=UPI00345A8B06